MNCQQFQNILDNLLIAVPTEAVDADMAVHLDDCPTCAREHRLAGQALASLDVPKLVSATSQLKEQIMSEVSAIATAVPKQAIKRPWFVKPVLTVGLAASLLVAGLVSFRSGPDGGPDKMPAFSLIRQAYAAEEAIFAADRVVHIVGEIIVKPIADPDLARMRWFPIMSLEASGKPRFHQLTLSAEVGKGYTVRDEVWYDTATDRFVRQLTVEGRPIYANSFDGQAVYWLDVTSDGKSSVVKHPKTAEFRSPKSPAELLGIAAGLSSRLDEKNKQLVTDAGEAKLEDGTTARVVKMGFPTPEADQKQNAFYLVTIRKDDNRIAKMEFVVGGESLLEVRRVKTETVEKAEARWDLAGLEKAVGDEQQKPLAGILPDMIVAGVSVEHMVEKATFKTYIFKTDPPWAGKREITDILDIVSPPNRMFAIAYRAADGRHVVLLQSPSYNKMLGPMTKIGKLVYTSPGGVKVWSGPRDKWLAGILLQSARASIKDSPSGDRTGYLLETPDGTYPALAINGQVTDEELHGLIDSLVPAKASE